MLDRTLGDGISIGSVLNDMAALGDPRERQLALDALSIWQAQQADLDGFTAYCKYVHNWILEPCHIEWAAHLINGERVCIVAPPDTGKSRLLRAWCEWSIGLRRDRAIMVIGNTIKQAKKIVWSVGQVIKTSQRYRQVFPLVRPTENWAMDAIYVTRDGLPMEYRTEATLAGYGIDGAYQGQHPDDMIIDDPTDQNDVNSPPTMLKQREQVTGVLYDRLKEGGNLFGILTRWADDDLVPTMEQIGVTILSYPAYKDTKSPYPWDEGPFNNEHPVSLLCEAWKNWKQLETARGHKMDDLFKLTFLCMTEGAVRGIRVFPMLDKDKHFRSMKAEHGDKGPDWKSHRSGADWGTTVQHQSAAVTVSKTKNGIIWVRAAWMSPKGDSTEMGAKLYEWKNEMGVFQVHYDRSQGALKSIFENWVGFAAFKGESSVDMRIMALRTLLTHNMFFVDNNGEGCRALWSQLTSYRYDETGRVLEIADDLVDALLYALFAIIEPSTVGRGPDIEIVAPREHKVGPIDVDNWKPTDEPLELPDPGRKAMGRWGI